MLMQLYGIQKGLAAYEKSATPGARFDARLKLADTPIQRWISRSYFGKDPSWFDWDGKRDDMFAKGDWKAEMEALHAAIQEGAKEEGDKAASTSPAIPETQAVLAP